jgi:lysozyme family protein
MLPQYAFEYILKVEGGYVNHKLDKGGKTNYGISEYILRKAKHIIPELENISSVKDLTLELAYKIYEEVYWDYYGLDEFKFPVNLVMFDGYVNHKPRSNGRCIQRACNNLIKMHNLPYKLLVVDGVVGKITRRTIHDICNTLEDGHIRLALEIIQERYRLYSRIVSRDKSQRVFLHGWVNRLIALHDEIVILLSK